VSTEPQSSTQRSAPAPDPELDAPSAPSAPPAPAAPAPGSQPPGSLPPGSQPLAQHKIRYTRISGLWFAVGFFAIVLLFLLIFILQNSRHVSISYLGMHGNLPLGVALLLSAVCGVLLTILAGAARISQLHAVARRHRRSDARRAPSPAGAPPAQ
jgi:lipopolysaccharide assembly protein A